MDQLGTFSIKGGLPFVSVDCRFSFHENLHFPGVCKLLHLNKGSPFLHFSGYLFDIGNSKNVLTTSFILEVLASAIQQEKEIKDIWIGK